MTATARPTRVTHIVHEFEGGGLETLVAAMARGYDPRQVVPSVISLSGDIGRLGREFGKTLGHMLAVRSVPLASMVAPVALSRAIRTTKPDVVHIHSGVWFKASLAARLSGASSVVFTEHGREHDDPAFGRWLDRRAARMTDTAVAVSHRLEVYMRDVVGIPPQRLVTIENGVDTDRFSAGRTSAAARAAFGIPEHALVVGSVGRLEPVKAYDRLLRAVAMVRDRGGVTAPVYVLLCGDGSQRQPLTALANSLGLTEHVRFPGWVGDPVDAYRLMDVFVLPSLSEGLSVSLLEAMSTGAVPLVTPVGANREVLGDALANQVVDAQDLTRFADALATTLTSDKKRVAMSRQSRERVRLRYSQRRMLDEYVGLYRRLVARGATAS